MSQIENEPKSQPDQRIFKEGDPNVIMVPLENFVYLDKSILDELYKERVPVQKLTEDDFMNLPKPVFTVVEKEESGTTVVPETKFSPEQ